MNEQHFREWFAKSADVIIKSYRFRDTNPTPNVLLLYCDGMCKIEHLEHVILPQLHAMLTDELNLQASRLNVSTMLQLDEITGPNLMESLTVSLYQGQVILFFEETQLVFALNIASPPNRSPEESSTETSIKGPRDAFTENITTNIALVRKRLLTRSLCCEKMDIGKRSHTSVALLYMDDIIDLDMIMEVKQRLLSLDVDGLISSAQLEERVSGTKYPFFPLMDYAGRPDYIADSLLRGRFAILIDGSPMALIAPASLMFILKSPEDVHFPFYYVAFERILRVGGLIVSTLLPGFWIAVSAFNIEQLPFPLVATISSSRLGLPISGPMDFIIMLVLFELFREAGMRLPKVVGQTVTVVGGLIVGDAAIRAGITSPTTLVVTSISTISMYTLVNQSLSGTVTVLRTLILIISATFGIFGFMLALMGVILYLATLESFGVPYLSPVSPPQFKEMTASLLAKPWSKLKRRPGTLNPNDATRQGPGEEPS
ncbi:spore germination protein [Paenibacillus sedimenti]|uniref:Spore germination protein n=1 Tax=Paenibacillus sedimenti TaxID=2770274 RepID=A0A926QIE8_9BACL|nr:spore germination protein [Paenibacillus sedimenti]MBD0379543.1 spore germination protein [Paenibacillus sedimenti]